MEQHAEHVRKGNPEAPGWGAEALAGQSSVEEPRTRTHTACAELCDIYDYQDTREFSCVRCEDRALKI